MLVFIGFANISRQVFFQSFGSFFFETQIRFIEFRKDIRIRTSFTFCHIDKLLIRFLIIIFLLKSFRIGICHFMNINHYSLPKDLKTRKYRYFFRRMLLDISKRKSQQDKSYDKFDKIFLYKYSFFSIHQKYKKINDWLIRFSDCFSRTFAKKIFSLLRNDKTIHYIDKKTSSDKLIKGLRPIKQ